MRGVQAGVKIIISSLLSIPDAAGPYSSMYLNHFGGAINAVGSSDTAFAHRSYVSNFVMDLHWQASGGNASTAAVLAWAQETYAAMSPYIAQAVYVNYLDRDLCNATLSSAPWSAYYYGANYERLLSVKTAVDPSNVFSWPQSVGSMCSL